MAVVQSDVLRYEGGESGCWLNTRNRQTSCTTDSPRKMFHKYADGSVRMWTCDEDAYTKGETGTQGLVGDQGETGIQGVTGGGLQGVTGLIGSTGLQGATGGSIIGATGSQGVTGLRGLTGTQGATGVGGDAYPTTLFDEYQNEVIICSGQTGIVQFHGNILTYDSGPNGLEFIDSEAVCQITNYGTLQGAQYTILHLRRNDENMNIGQGPGISFEGQYDGSTYIPYAGIQGVKANAVASNYAGKLLLKTTLDSGVITTRVEVSETGMLNCLYGMQFNGGSVLNNYTEGSFTGMTTTDDFVTGMIDMIDYTRVGNVANLHFPQFEGISNSGTFRIYCTLPFTPKRLTFTPCWAFDDGAPIFGLIYIHPTSPTYISVWKSDDEDFISSGYKILTPISIPVMIE